MLSIHHTYFVLYLHVRQGKISFDSSRLSWLKSLRGPLYKAVQVPQVRAGSTVYLRKSLGCLHRKLYCLQKITPIGPYRDMVGDGEAYRPQFLLIIIFCSTNTYRDKFQVRRRCGQQSLQTQRQRVAHRDEDQVEEEKQRKAQIQEDRRAEGAGLRNKGGRKV